MKTLKFGYMAGIALGALAMTSCAGDELLDNPAANGKSVFVRTTVSVPTETTRTILNEDSEANLSWEWKEGDRIYATKAGNGIGYLTVKEVNATDHTQAVVEGDLSGLTDGDNKVEFHYLGTQLDAEGNQKNGMDLSGSYALDLSNKFVEATGTPGDDFTVDYNYLTQYDILANQADINIQVKNNIGNIEDFYLIHKLAMGHITINGVPNIASVEVTTDGTKGVYTKADYDLATRELKNEAYEAFKTDCADFYFPIIPQENADFNFRIIDNEGRVWTAEFEYKSGDQMGEHAVLNIQAGHFYRTGYQIGLSPELTAERVMLLNLHDHEGKLIDTYEQQATADQATNGYDFDLAGVDLSTVLPSYMVAQGWAETQNGEKVAEIGGKYHMTVDEPTKDLYLLADNKQVTFTLNFDLNLRGGTADKTLEPLTAVEILKGSSVSHTFSVANYSVTKHVDGVYYSFSYWKYGEEVLFPYNRYVTLISTGENMSATVTAVYGENYKIQLDPNMPAGLTTNQRGSKYTAFGDEDLGTCTWTFESIGYAGYPFIPKPKETTTNYEFLGWSRSSSATTPDKGMSIAEITAGDYVEFTEHRDHENLNTVNLYGVWKNKSTNAGGGGFTGEDPLN